MFSFIVLFVLFYNVLGFKNKTSNTTINNNNLNTTLNVRVVSQEGFGDLTNQYAFGMATFKGSIYVGTLNAINAPLGVLAFFAGIEFATKGTQIYKGDIDINANQYIWTQVLNNGNGNINNYGIRKFVEIGNYLYGVTGNHVDGCEVWRSIDGITWEIVADNGFGDPENTSGRGLGAYKNYIYIGVENRNTAAKIYRRSIDNNGDFTPNSEWEQVVSDGLGYEFNWWFSDFQEYLGYLYVGTLNVGGFQLWRTDDGINYELLIFRAGNPNGQISFNTASMDLIVYNNQLFISTMNFIIGASLYTNIDNTGKNFVPILIGGNNNRNNAYIWQMIEYNNRLYIGTFDISGQFDLYSSNNPNDNTQWVTETVNAYGEANQYGVRTMSIYNDNLIIGSATAAAEDGCTIFEAKFTN